MPSEIRGSDNFSSDTVGKVLQVQQTVKTGAASFNLNNTWADVPGVSVTITPSSSSNKVLVSFCITSGYDLNWAYPKFKLLRNGTEICLGDVNGSRLRGSGSAGGSSGNTAISNNVNMEFLDEPATTSALTYKLQTSGYASRLYYIGLVGNSDANTGITMPTTITAKEIGA